ncbi:MAG: inositol monophosphatase [Candidatus Nomurabacteria bacterium]|nr:inositol monophosphatase [Candidatus Nomurabacteria bacterium]
MKKFDRDYAASLAHTVGELSCEEFQHAGVGTVWKEDETPFTVGDKIAHEFLVNSVRRDFPRMSIISEEGLDTIEYPEYTFLCDPIDGSIPFNQGIPIWTNVFSVLREGEPILAAINDPVMKRLFIAEKGKGATLNGQPIRVSQKSELKNAEIVGVWWRGSKFRLHNIFGELMERGAGWANPCSIAHPAANVARGVIEATIFAGDKPWETAAIKLIVEEAGGRVTDIYGDEFKRLDGPIKGHIASNGLIHEELVKISQSFNCA